MPRPGHGDAPVRRRRAGRDCDTTASIPGCSRSCLDRSRYIETTASSSRSLIETRSASCRGVSMITSWDPYPGRTECRSLSVRFAPNRTAGNLLGTTRTVQPGSSLLRVSATIPGNRFSWPGQNGQSGSRGVLLCRTRAVVECAGGSNAPGRCALSGAMMTERPDVRSCRTSLMRVWRQ